MPKEKKKLLSDIKNNSLSSIFVKILSFLQNLFVANILGPVLFGIKNAISLIYDYGVNAHLGVLSQHNVERNSNEEKNKKYANKISDVTFSFLIFTSIIITLIGTIVAYLVNYSLEIKWSIFIIGVAISLSFFNYFYVSIFTSQKNYSLLFKFNIITGIANLICVIPLTYFYKVFGFFLGISVASFVSLLYLYLIRNKIYIPKFEIDTKIYLNLLKHGIILLLLQLFWLVILSIDRIFVLKFFGSEILGYYAVGLLFSSYVRLLIQFISNPLIPRIYQKKKLEIYIIEPNRIIYSVLYYLIFISIFLVPFLIMLFPKFGLSQNFIKILIFSTIFVPDLAVQYFIAKNKKWFIINVSIILLLLANLLNFLAIWLGFGAIGIAFATLITLFLYGNIINIFCYKQILGDWKKTAHKFWEYFWPLLYAILGFLIIWAIFNFCLYNYINFYISKILQCVLFTAWYLPIIFKLEKKNHIFELLLKKVKK